MPLVSKGYTDALYCSAKLKKEILEDCVREYRRVHPELAEVHVTHFMILNSMKNYYLARGSHESES